MTRILSSALAGCFIFLGSALNLFANDDSRIFELRIYQASEGKLDALEARFRDHTTTFFEKYGIENIGYWVSSENADNQLVYILAYPSLESRKASWKAFLSDPDWKKAKKASEVDGKLVQKIDSQFMTTTDYSPMLSLQQADDSRVFELRVYTSTDGNLANLDKRFSDATISLFAKHGMENLCYWHLTPNQEGVENTLIYLLAHQSKEAAQVSWKGFLADPEWKAAAAASRVNGRLVVKGGVKSTYLRPLDFSPLQ